LGILLFLLFLCLLSFLSLPFSLFVYQHHGWVSTLQKLTMLDNMWCWPPPTAGSWWNQLGCFDSWSLPSMLLLKVSELPDDCCCCLNCSSVLLSLFFSVGFHLFCVCWYVVKSEISITLLLVHLSILWRLT